MSQPSLSAFHFPSAPATAAFHFPATSASTTIAPAGEGASAFRLVPSEGVESTYRVAVGSGDWAPTGAVWEAGREPKSGKTGDVVSVESPERDESRSPIGGTGQSDGGTTSEEGSPSEGERPRKRRDLPRLPGKRKRGQKRKALTVLRSDALKKLAVKKLRDDFFAPSGAPSLNSKRKTAEDFARAALKLDPEEDRASIYPLTPKLVEEVAAALKEADYRGAEQ